VGASFAFVGGVVFFASGRKLVGEFRRRKLYADHGIHADSAELDEIVEAVVHPETAGT
jgi:hypothetical protein